jgi:hypothetical protein
MRKTLVITSLLASGALAMAQQASVHVTPPRLDGPRALQPQTATAVVKDYIESWQTLNKALDQNRVDLLERDFVGDAKDKIATTIKQQAKDGLRTSYKDASHNVQIVFYSPEGLSVQLTDDVEYDLQLQDQDKLVGNQHIRAHYVVVLTPSETRWRVREFEAVPAQ